MEQQAKDALRTTISLDQDENGIKNCIILSNSEKLNIYKQLHSCGAAADIQEGEVKKGSLWGFGILLLKNGLTYSEMFINNKLRMKSHEVSRWKNQADNKKIH